MISDARGSHVSPGIYVEEKDVTYSVKSLGITSLGLVGETLFGPAFENIPIENWTEFIDYFGGTSSEKFKGTGLPKYELPYIAKSYLEESKRLNVVRVLGLSGYHAGPAWAIKYGTKIIGILRSKMTYESVEDECLPYGKTKSPEAIVKSIELSSACTEYLIEDNCTATGNASATTSNKFSIKATTVDGQEYVYNLSLEPNDSTYIYNVLSSSPDTGTTPVYLEALYESSFSASSDNSVFSSIPLDIILSSDTAYFKVVEENCNEYVLEYIGDNH